MLQLLKKFKYQYIDSKKGFIGDVIALHDYKAVYFAIPKVANSSLKSTFLSVLKNKIDDKYLNPEDPTRQGYVFMNPGTVSYLKKERILIDKLNGLEKDYFTFGFVRNPWDRLVSCYFDKVKKKNRITGQALNNSQFTDGVSNAFLLAYRNKVSKDMSFREFAEFVCETPDWKSNNHFKSQHLFLSDTNGKIVCGCIGKLETLPADFEQIAQQCGFPHLSIPQKLKSDRDKYRTYFDDELAQKVAKRYQKDLDLFGYTF
ncbi:MAG: sulfotransferase family protein [Marinoscillum sp.]